MIDHWISDQVDATHLAVFHGHMTVRHTHLAVLHAHMTALARPPAVRHTNMALRHTHMTARHTHMAVRHTCTAARHTYPAVDPPRQGKKREPRSGSQRGAQEAGSTCLWNRLDTLLGFDLGPEHSASFVAD
jgi:hypothetical protein